MSKFRTGTVLRFAEGNFRIDRLHQRSSGPTYDITRLSDGKRSPEYLEAMLTEGVRQGARFDRGDHVLWKNRPGRVLDRTWSVSAQCVTYTVVLDDRTDSESAVQEHELTNA